MFFVRILVLIKKFTTVLGHFDRLIWRRFGFLWLWIAYRKIGFQKRNSSFLMASVETSCPHSFKSLEERFAKFFDLLDSLHFGVFVRSSSSFAVRNLFVPHLGHLHFHIVMCVWGCWSAILVYENVKKVGLFCLRVILWNNTQMGGVLGLRYVFPRKVWIFEGFTDRGDYLLDTLSFSAKFESFRKRKLVFFCFRFRLRFKFYVSEEVFEFVLKKVHFFFGLLVQK